MNNMYICFLIIIILDYALIIGKNLMNSKKLKINQILLKEVAVNIDDKYLLPELWAIVNQYCPKFTLVADNSLDLLVQTTPSNSIHMIDDLWKIIESYLGDLNLFLSPHIIKKYELEKDFYSNVFKNMLNPIDKKISFEYLTKHERKLEKKSDQYQPVGLILLCDKISRKDEKSFALADIDHQMKTFIYTCFNIVKLDQPIWEKKRLNFFSEWIAKKQKQMIGETHFPSNILNIVYLYYNNDFGGVYIKYTVPKIILMDLFNCLAEWGHSQENIKKIIWLCCRSKLPNNWFTLIELMRYIFLKSNVNSDLVDYLS
jgi:hypothetical protein